MSENEILISLNRALTDVKDLIEDLRREYPQPKDRDGLLRVLKASAEVGIEWISGYMESGK